MLGLLNIIVEKVMKFLGLAVLALSLAAITPVVDTAQADKVINMRVAKARTKYTALQECLRRREFIDFGIPLVDCLGAGTDRCHRGGLYRPDKAYCHAHFILHNYVTQETILCSGVVVMSSAGRARRQAKVINHPIYWSCYGDRSA